MPLLKRAPPLIGSAQELIGIAHEIEKEAARRYQELASRMRLRGEAALARLFAFLASIEEKHAQQVAARVAPQRGDVAARVAWEVPESFDEEEGSSRLLTPYRALAVAVRNEDRAFAFYSYVAAGAGDPATRRLAEDLAKDELAHAALLRRERRRAYREEGLGAARAAAFTLPASLEELRQLVAETEWHAAQHHRAAAAAGAGGPRAAAALEAAAEQEQAAAREAARRIGVPLAAPGAAPAAGVEDALRLLEAAFERYADIAERTGDPEVLAEAQRLAAAALGRLTLVRGSIDNTLLDPLP